MEWYENEDFWRDLFSYIFSAERFSASKEEVTQIIALTQCTGGSLLDLCCGPGRHALEFAQRGFQVTGVDKSEFLLGEARERASQANISVEWIQQDMRLFHRPAAFDLVCNLYTSFGYFEDERDNFQVLQNIYENLKENGVLIIEVAGKERLARTWQNSICTELADGSLLVQRPQLCDDWCRVSSEWTLIEDGRARSFTFEHSIYSARELKDLLLRCGFKHVQLFGSLQGTPYDLDAARLVAVARKSSLSIP
jgi:SAM-dependent methyltransferase